MTVDREAAARMVRLSGQRGVPVITIDDEVIVGFDRRRLAELLANKAPVAPQLGIAVADAAPRLQVAGAYVGRVKPASPAEQAGLRPGDVIVEFNGHAVHNAVDLESLSSRLRRRDQVALAYVRGGQRTHIELVI